MGKFFASPPKLTGGLGRHRTGEINGQRHRPAFKIVTLAWLTLGIASVVLAVIAIVVLRSERQSTALLYQMNLVASNLQRVLSDLAAAETAQSAYLLTDGPSSVETFQRSRQALGLECAQLTALVKHNPAQRQEVDRIRDLVQKDLDELQGSITSHAAGASQAASAEALTNRARKLTEALRQSISGISLENEGMLAKLARERRTRLAGALAAVSCLLFLAASYVLIGQIIVGRSESRRGETEAALRASESRFATLCDQAPIGIYSTDAEGRCVYVNSRWSQISGLSSAESVGHGWAKVLHPDDRKTVVENWQAYAQRGTPWDYRLLTFDGMIRWIRALGGPIYSPMGEITGYIGTIEDTTEQRRAHDALQESEALNRAVLNSLPANIAVLDTHGVIQTANEDWQRFAEANSPAPACSGGIGANYLEMCKRAMGDGSGDAGRAFAGIRDVLDGELQSFRMEYPYDSATGKRWFHMLVTPLAGVTHGGVVIAHADITERKAAVDALREALQQLQLIADNMPAGVTRCSRDLRYMWVSRTYAAWLKRTGPEEFAGRPILDVIGQEAYETMQPFVERVLSGERVEYEAQANYYGAGPRYVHAVYVPTKSEGQTVDGWISVVIDVTERCEAEQRMRESEVRFRNMADAAPVMIWVSDPEKGCIFFNKVWLDFTGRTMEQESGNGWMEGVHPDDRGRCLATYNSSFEARRSFRMDYRLRRADGEYRWVLDNGVPRFGVSGIFEGYIGSCIDITERKDEEQLREELQRGRERLAEARGMERFRMSFEEAPVGMALIRGDGVWLRVNRTFCQMTGYNESELISRCGDITHPEDRAEESRLFSRILSGETAVGSLEERYLHKQGQVICVLLSIAAVEWDETGRPVHLVAHVLDLTERKRVEQELETSRAQMLSTSRLSALGIMAGGIAHEINNPLAVIHASAENMVRMAESGAVEVPAVLRNSLRITHTADRISRIIRSLRHVAREGRADEFRATPVRRIVEETRELCTERFRAHNVRLSVSPIDPDLVVNCRETQICQILLNLLQNAFDALVELEGDRWVELDVSDSPGWVIFSVIDSGPGIPLEHRERIMEPFFTTKPVGKGVGLGLSISKSFALEHGGTLELDQGSPRTCFRLKLPTSKPA